MTANTEPEAGKLTGEESNKPPRSKMRRIDRPILWDRSIAGLIHQWGRYAAFHRREAVNAQRKAGENAHSSYYRELAWDQRQLARQYYSQAWTLKWTLHADEVQPAAVAAARWIQDRFTGPDRYRITVCILAVPYGFSLTVHHYDREGRQSYPIDSRELPTLLDCAAAALEWNARRAESEVAA